MLFMAQYRTFIDCITEIAMKNDEKIKIKLE